jgi:hypothetical protein
LATAVTVMAPATDPVPGPSAMSRPSGGSSSAVEVAARVLEAGLGLVEVRPVLTLGGMEM